MASLEDRVKVLEIRVNTGAVEHNALASEVDHLDRRVQELEEAAAPTGVPMGKIGVGSKVKIVRSKWRPQHVGQVVEVVEKDPYFEGQWGLPMENDVWYYPEEDLELVDEARFSGKTSKQIFDEGYDEGYDEGLAAGRGEKEALIDQLTDELTESREKAAELERLNNTQEETIRRLREQVDILQASHGSRGEVSKPAGESAS